MAIDVVKVKHCRNVEDEYDYDPLHRLKEAERGLWDGSTFAKKQDSRRFTQDILNNFTRIETDADGADGYEADEIEDRDNFADANELLGRDTDNDGTDEIEIEYDLNGNLTCTDSTPGGGSRLVKYRYDAWNRLVAIDHEEGESTFPVAAYQYNALHHRVLVRVDRDPEDSTHTLNQQRVLYYSPAWQVLEERIDDNWSAESSSVDRHVQHVWGAFRGYIDDIILHREDGNADGDYNDAFDSTWYHLTDPQFSTVAILDLSGAVVEKD